MKPSLAILSSHLDGESYTMRKCVLAVMGEIVAKVLSREDLDEAGKDDRDGFLDCLEDHVHDVHAHVRSHVLNIWGKLCKDKCIPLTRQHSVLELCVGRLRDKSSNVRKAAVQLLTTLLESNPFAAKLQTMDLEMRLKEEEVKLAEMAPEDAEETDPVEEWNNIKASLKEAITSVVEAGEITESDAEKCWEDATPGEVCARVAGFIGKKNVVKAVSLVKDAQAVFTREDIFIFQANASPESQETPESSDKEDDDEEDADIKLQIKHYLNILKNIFFETKKKPDVDLSQSMVQSQ